MFNKIHHRTNRVAKVDQLTSRKGILEAANTDGLTKRLSIFLPGKAAKLAKIDCHRHRSTKEVIFIAYFLVGNHSLTRRLGDAPTAFLSWKKSKVMRRHIKRQRYTTWNTSTCWKNHSAESNCLRDGTSTQTSRAYTLLWRHFPDPVSILVAIDCIVHLYRKYANS